MLNFTTTTPKICDHNGDLSKQWYVYFRAKNIETGEVKQFRYKLGINRFKTKFKRREAAKIALATITSMIEEEGWNPFSRRCEKDSVALVKNLIVYLEEMFSIRSASLRQKSVENYGIALKFFRQWCEEKGYANLQPKAFTKIMALEYADHLRVDRGLAAKTCNNTLSYLKTIFFMLVEREIIDKNPFCSVKKFKEERGRSVAMTPMEVERITTYMRKNNLRLFYATQFVRYAFIRRNELINLKICDIDLVSHTITIPANVSKTGVQDSITIPRSLEKIILEMRLENVDPNFYVFGKGMIPGPKKITRPCNLSDRHKEIVEKLGMRKEIIFYGWKHTGCVELYNIVKDPYVVCRQCRHSDIKMTMRYLRTLGLGTNEQVREW